MINPNDVLTYDQLKARCDKLALEIENLFAAAGEVYAAGYNHGHLNTVDGIAYTEGVETTFAERGAQVLAEYAELPATDNTPAQLEALAGGAPCKDA